MFNTEGSEPARAARIAWRRSFDDQLTPATLLRVRRFAEARGRPLVRAGLLDQRSAAVELMNEAIGATLAGNAAWDPARKTLDQHLVDVIQWQTRNALRRNSRIRMGSLDDIGDDSSADGRRLEAEASLQRPPATTAPTAMSTAARRVLEEVRELADGDTDVIRIIATIQAGDTDHGELIKASGLRAATFRNARRRLARIVARLPEATRAAAQAALE